ncbi:unnamed protein product [Ectocarpus sp. 6 AP-2014]
MALSANTAYESSTCPQGHPFPHSSGQESPTICSREVSARTGQWAVDTAVPDPAEEDLWASWQFHHMFETTTTTVLVYDANVFLELLYCCTACIQKLEEILTEKS